MNKLRTVLLGGLVAVVSFAGVNYLAGDQAHALNVNARDCNSNSTIYCGVLTPGELKQKFDTDSTGDLPAIYAHYGVTAEMVNSMTEKEGYVTRSGDVMYNGKVVATGAYSVGRDSKVGTPIQIGGKTYYQHGSGQNWYADVDAIAAHIWFNADGKFAGAVYCSCGNPVQAKPVPVVPKPVYKCNALTASITKITEGQSVNFATDATASNGAKIKGYSYDFGDGTTATADQTTSHTYTKTGTFTATVTVEVLVDGKVVAAPGSCAAQVTVCPQMCTIPGKTKYTKDDERCRCDKPSISITKTVNNVKDATIPVGQTFEYEIVVKNTGNVALTKDVVTDTAPSQVTLVSASVGTISDNSWTYTIHDLAVGASKSFTITAQYTAYADGTHVNKVCVDTEVIRGSHDACDTAQTETSQPITVCDTKDNTIKTIDRSQYDESHMTTDTSKCGDVTVCDTTTGKITTIAKNEQTSTQTTYTDHCTPITVCNINTQATTTIMTSDYDSSKYTKGACAPAVTVMPHTGMSDSFSGILGVSSLVGVGYAYFDSRRAR